MENVYKHLGSAIKRVRKEKRVTQADLAKELGLSRPALSNIENGKQRIALHQLIQAAQVLEVDLSKLIPALAIRRKKMSLIDEYYAYRLEDAETQPQKKILFNILGDFTDRRGLRQEWEQIDSDIQEEILATWLEMIELGSREEVV